MDDDINRQLEAAFQRQRHRDRQDAPSFDAVWERAVAGASGGRCAAGGRQVAILWRWVFAGGAAAAAVVMVVLFNGLGSRAGIGGAESPDAGSDSVAEIDFDEFDLLIDEAFAVRHPQVLGWSSPTESLLQPPSLATTEGVVR